MIDPAQGVIYPNSENLIQENFQSPDFSFGILFRHTNYFAGISAAGACWVAQQIALREHDATIVFVVCDRGDRYPSTGVFPA